MFQSGPVKITAPKALTPRNATVIQRALDNNVVITKIDSSCVVFSQYTVDIINSQCSTVTTDHTVVIVGRGQYVDSAGNKTKYFILRNSWGTDWGL